MAYTSIDNPELYFQVKTYTGNGTAIGSGGLALTFDGDEDMSPNMVWIKGRSTTYSHQLYDTVRGVTKRILPDLTTEEETDTEALTAFGSDGFTLGSNAGVNTSSGTHVAWAWKEQSGLFDIVSYSGNGSARTISHSLSAVPSFIIIKALTSTQNWAVYYGDNTDHLELNTSDATDDDDSVWNDTSPTSSVFSVGTSHKTNKSGKNYIAYLFANNQGAVKCGSYTGNSNADGAFIYLGFRPAFIMIKRTNGTQWWIMKDNKRDGVGGGNPNKYLLYPNASDAEETNSNAMDFLSNGFKFRESTSGGNNSGGTYIYMAFAEAPFVNSNGVPCNAR